MGEVNRYQFYEHLKPYLMAPPDVRCELTEKNKPEYYVLNVLRVIMSNKP